MVERAGLENRSPGNWTVGSNPTPSAMFSTGCVVFPDTDFPAQSSGVTKSVTFFPWMYSPNRDDWGVPPGSASKRKSVGNRITY